MKRIVSKQELRSIMGGAAPTTPMKIHRCLNGQAKAFIEKSPLLFISTSDLAGHPTVSPKGDLPGFVRIENSSTLLIP